MLQNPAVGTLRLRLEVRGGNPLSAHPPEAYSPKERFSKYLDMLDPRPGHP